MIFHISELIFTACVIVGCVIGDAYMIIMFLMGKPLVNNNFGESIFPIILLTLFILWLIRKFQIWYRDTIRVFKENRAKRETYSDTKNINKKNGISHFDDLRAQSEADKIRNGHSGNLSISQITYMLVDLPKAKLKLYPSKYDELMNLYEELRKMTEKRLINRDEYIEMCIRITSAFNEIAPFENYAAGYQADYVYMLNYLNKKRNAETSAFDTKENEVQNNQK